MRILAFEFSSAQRSVAALDADPEGVARAWGEAVETDSGQAMRPFGLIEAALREAGLEREQIEAIAVGLGPGSYTGIRAAIAMAQGWQLARGAEERGSASSPGLRVFGISSAECIAATAQEAGVIGRVNVVVDAQRDEFYLARYGLDAGGWHELEPLRLAARAEVWARAEAGECLLGPEITRWFASGRMIFPRAVTLARLALKRKPARRADVLEPIYLRPTSFVKAPLMRF